MLIAEGMKPALNSDGSRTSGVSVLISNGIE